MTEGPDPEAEATPDFAQALAAARAALVPPVPSGRAERRHARRNARRGRVALSKAALLRVRTEGIGRRVDGAATPLRQLRRRIAWRRRRLGLWLFLRRYWLETAVILIVGLIAVFWDRILSLVAPLIVRVL